MSKTMKDLMIGEYRDRIGDYSDALLISIRGLDATTNNQVRVGLQQKNIHVTVIRNSLARRAFEGTGLAALEPLLEGPSAVALGGNSVVEVARELVELARQFPDVELKGAVLDGTLFSGEEGVKRLSNFPTREEAIAQAVTLILSPARNLMGQVKGPGGRLLGIVKSIEDKLEKGEAITKVA